MNRRIARIALLFHWIEPGNHTQFHQEEWNSWREMVILRTNHMHRSCMKRRIARIVLVIHWVGAGRWMRTAWELHTISPGVMRFLVEMGPGWGGVQEANDAKTS